MNKIGVYKRVGNKEQLTPVEQQESMKQLAPELHLSPMAQRVPMPTIEELRAEGYDVLSLPSEEDEDEAPVLTM